MATPQTNQHLSFGDNDPAPQIGMLKERHLLEIFGYGATEDKLDSSDVDVTVSFFNNTAILPTDKNAMRGVTAELRPGSIVDSKYKILGLIGQGGMATIYKVHHVLLQKEMALKTFQSQNLTEDSCRRFQREAQSIAKLHHKNIVDVFDFGITEGCLPYYTMELLTGQSLANQLSQSGRLAPTEALQIFCQVAQALAHAHRHNIVHRDIKPANIVLIAGSSPQSCHLLVKLVDFGIAKLVENTPATDDQSLTRAGIIFGSPFYMSPEQSLALPTDHRTDIYSLGCSLYETLTGKPPFVGKTAMITMLHHQSLIPPTLAESGIGLTFPKRLEAVIAKLLAKNPEDRYQNCDEVAEGLEWCCAAFPPGLQPEAQNVSPQSIIDVDAEDGAIVLPKAPALGQLLMIIVGASVASLSLTGALLNATGILNQALENPSSPSRSSIDTKSEINKPHFHGPGQIANGTPYLVELHNNTRIFNFARQLGTLTIDGGPNIPCHGRLLVPVGAKIVFYPDPGPPDLFRKFGPNDLYGINLSNPVENYWSDQHIEEISRLTGLKMLDLSHTGSLKQRTIMLLDKLINLKKLNLTSAEITGEDLVNLRILPQIEDLTVSDIAGLPVLLKYLADNSVHIKVLVANNSNLTDTDIATIAKIKSVVCFSGTHNSITTKAITKLVAAPDWQILNLRHNDIRDKSIESFAKYKRLRYINLSAEYFGPNSFEQLKLRLAPYCKVMDLPTQQFERECALLLQPSQQ